MRLRYSFSSSCAFRFICSSFSCSTFMFSLLSCTSPTSFRFPYNSYAYNCSRSCFSYAAISRISSTSPRFSSILSSHAVTAASLASSISIFLRCCCSSSSYLSFSFISFFQLSNYDSSRMFNSNSLIRRYSSSIFSFSLRYSRRMAATFSFMSTSPYFGIGLAVTFFYNYLVCPRSTSYFIRGRLLGRLVV